VAASRGITRNAPEKTYAGHAGVSRPAPTRALLPRTPPPSSPAPRSGCRRALRSRIARRGRRPAARSWWPRCARRLPSSHPASRPISVLLRPRLPLLSSEVLPAKRSLRPGLDERSRLEEQGRTIRTAEAIVGERRSLVVKEVLRAHEEGWGKERDEYQMLCFPEIALPRPHERY
jgi:hypothetical protein